MDVPAETFLFIGGQMCNQKRKMKSKKILLQRFKAHFGITSERCAHVWHLINKYKTSQDAIRDG